MRAANYPFFDLHARQQAERRGGDTTVGSLNVLMHDADGGLVELGDTITELEYFSGLGFAHESSADRSDRELDVEAVIATLPDDLKDLCRRLRHRSIAAVARARGSQRVHHHHRAGLLRLLQKGWPPVKVGHDYVGPDPVLNKELDRAIGRYPDVFLAALFDELDSLFVFEGRACPDHKHVLALYFSLQNLGVKGLPLYQAGKGLRGLLVLLSAIAKLCADSLVVREPVDKFHKV